MLGLFLPNPVFAHGQLYVAFSRVRRLRDIKVLVLDTEIHGLVRGSIDIFTRNVVYPEVLGGSIDIANIQPAIEPLRRCLSYSEDSEEEENATPSPFEDYSDLSFEIEDDGFLSEYEIDDGFYNNQPTLDSEDSNDDDDDDE